MEFFKGKNKFISGLIKFFVVGLFFIGVFFVFTQSVSAEPMYCECGGTIGPETGPDCMNVDVPTAIYFADTEARDREAFNSCNSAGCIPSAIHTGSCPAPSSPSKLYRCLKKSNNGCVLFTAQNDIEAEQKAIAQCDTESFIEGTCPATSDGGTEIPSGKTAQELLAEASDSLNPARINQPTDLINKAIRMLMAFIGSISLVLYVYAGILWLSASGTAERVDKAKKVIVWTTLGVVFMLASYMLVSFVFNVIPK